MEETTTAVLSESESTVTRFRGIATSRFPAPRTDEIVAIAILERLQGSSVDEIRLTDNANCTYGELMAFVADGLIPVELGSMNYKSDKTTSASESLTKTLGYYPENLSPGIKKVLDLLSRRNGNGPKGSLEGGFMNDSFMSLPQIWKDLYEFPGYDEMDLIRRYMDVAHTFIESEDNKANGTDPVRKGQPFPEELQNLVAATMKCNNAAFTPGRYLRDLWLRGESVEQIREKVTFMVTARTRWDKAKADAKANWPTMDKLGFRVNGLTCVVVETDNPFVAKIGIRTVDVLISRRSDGYTVIMNRQRDTFLLSAMLMGREPGKWICHEPTGNLINGRGGAATNLSTADLIDLITQFPPR